MIVGAEQKLVLIRAAGLIGRHPEVLAPFEVDLVRECVERYRDRGDRMTLTVNEWAVVDAAVAAMDAARAEAEQASREAAAAMRGAA
jgi:hypothetical protein